MPAVSKRQFGFMARVAAGKEKAKGLSKKQAKEFLNVKVSKLPNRVKNGKPTKKVKVTKIKKK